METRLETIIAKSKNSAIWSAIAQNQLDAARSAIAKQTYPHNKSWFRHFKKRATNTDDAILQVASAILLPVPGKELPVLHLFLDRNGADQFAELIRLLFSLHYNGHFIPQSAPLSKIITHLLNDLAEQVRLQAGNYPNSSIAGHVWVGGATLRRWSELLANYYERVNDLRSRANALQNKCKITCAIMSHYPHSVGPDMIVAAMALEAIGEINSARRYYEAIIADFECIADEIRNNPDEEVWEEQIISLQSLQQAYVRMNKLDPSKQYDNSLQFINTVIERGVTQYPDEDED